MPHHSFPHPPLHVRLFGVEDGARVLHPAEPGRGLDVGELLVRERSDEPLHHLDDLRRAAERDGISVGGVFGVGPHFDRNPAARGTMTADGKIRRSQDHRVRRDGMVLRPLPEPDASAGVRMVQGRTVGYHLPSGRGVDDEPDGGFLPRFIDGGEPVPGTLRPIVREHGTVSVGVVAPDETISRHAVIMDTNASEQMCIVVERHSKYSTVIIDQDPRTSAVYSLGID